MRKPLILLLFFLVFFLGKTIAQSSQTSKLPNDLVPVFKDSTGKEYSDQYLKSMQERQNVPLPAPRLNTNAEFESNRENQPLGNVNAATEEKKRENDIRESTNTALYLFLTGLLFAIIFGMVKLIQIKENRNNSNYQKEQQYYYTTTKK